MGDLKFEFLKIVSGVLATTSSHCNLGSPRKFLLQESLMDMKLTDTFALPSLFLKMELFNNYKVVN